MLEAAALWLDSAGLRAFAGGDNYPRINTLHLLGLVMLVGGIGVVDLRTLGAWRRLPLAALSQALTPVAITGLVVQVITGVLLFAADGASLAGSGVFRTKLLLVALALANAAAYRLAWRGAGEGWSPPPLARAMAGLSLLLWLAVGVYGRMIAYS